MKCVDERLSASALPVLVIHWTIPLSFLSFVQSSDNSRFWLLLSQDVPDRNALQRWSRHVVASTQLAPLCPASCRAVPSLPGSSQSQDEMDLDSVQKYAGLADTRLRPARSFPASGRDVPIHSRS